MFLAFFPVIVFLLILVSPIFLKKIIEHDKISKIVLSLGIFIALIGFVLNLNSFLYYSGPSIEDLIFEFIGGLRFSFFTIVAAFLTWLIIQIYPRFYGMEINTVEKKNSRNVPTVPTDLLSIQKIKKLVSKNSFTDIFDSLFVMFADDRTFENEIILLKSRLDRLLSEESKGLISKESANIELNNIKSAILNLCDKYASETNKK